MKRAEVYNSNNTPVNWGLWDEETNTFYQGVREFVRPIGEGERVVIIEGDEE